jgi:hypothetical protein
LPSGELCWLCWGCIIETIHWRLCLLSFVPFLPSSECHQQRYGLFPAFLDFFHSGPSSCLASRW